MKKRIADIFVFCLLAICLSFISSCNKENTTSASIDILKIGKADCIVINTGAQNIFNVINLRKGLMTKNHQLFHLKN